MVVVIEKIKPDTPEWVSLINDIIVCYPPGLLIPHDYLKTVLGIRPLLSGNFETTEDLLIAHQEQQFEYMTLIDQLRHDLLVHEKYYLDNVRGQGYKLLNPSEQQQYGFDFAIKEIKKIISQSIKIMTFVRFDEISNDEKSKGTGLMARLSNLQQVFNSIRKNK